MPGGMCGISSCNNPHWWREGGKESGKPLHPVCECKHPDFMHKGVQEGRGCHATLYENVNPWKHVGPCESPGCACSEFRLKTPAH